MLLQRLLSPRQFQVLQGIGKGFKFARIASDLSISPNTVRTHSREVYLKLGADGRFTAAEIYHDHLRRNVRLAGSTGFPVGSKPR